MNLEKSNLVSGGHLSSIGSGGPILTIIQKTVNAIKTQKKRINLHLFAFVVFFSFWDHCWAIFMVNILKRIAGKLRRIILLHLGLITFRFHDWKTLKPLFVMVLGPGGRDHDSQNQYYLSLETPGHSK